MISKYKAIKTTVNGIVFDSKKEAAYYSSLLVMKMAKSEKDKVTKIELQPRFDYHITYSANGKEYKKKAFYKADFKVHFADGSVQIIDVKGFKTAEYKRKKKIVESLYNIEIIEK